MLGGVGVGRRGPQRVGGEQPARPDDDRHANQPDDHAQPGGERQRHLDHHAAPGHGRQPPEQRAQRARSRCRRRRSSKCGPIPTSTIPATHGERRPGPEACARAVAEQHARGGRRQHRLDVEHDVDDRRVAVLEREREQHRADRRARDAGEHQPADRLARTLRSSPSRGSTNGSAQRDEDHVLPEHQHVGLEHVVERDPPRALGPPQRRTERHQPGPELDVRLHNADPSRCCARAAGRDPSRRVKRDSGPPLLLAATGLQLDLRARGHVSRGQRAPDVSADCRRRWPMQLTLGARSTARSVIRPIPTAAGSPARSIRRHAADAATSDRATDGTFVVPRDDSGRAVPARPSRSIPTMPTGHAGRAPHAAVDAPLRGADVRPPRPRAAAVSELRCSRPHAAPSTYTNPQRSSRPGLWTKPDVAARRGTVRRTSSPSTRTRPSMSGPLGVPRTAAKATPRSSSTSMAPCTTPWLRRQRASITSPPTSTLLARSTLDGRHAHGAAGLVGPPARRPQSPARRMTSALGPLYGTPAAVLRPGWRCSAASPMPSFAGNRGRRARRHGVQSRCRSTPRRRTSSSRRSRHATRRDYPTPCTLATATRGPCPAAPRS